MRGHQMMSPWLYKKQKRTELAQLWELALGEDISGGKKLAKKLRKKTSSAEGENTAEETEEDDISSRGRRTIGR